MGILVVVKDHGMRVEGRVHSPEKQILFKSMYVSKSIERIWVHRLLSHVYLSERAFSFYVTSIFPICMRLRIDYCRVAILNLRIPQHMFFYVTANVIRCNKGFRKCFFPLLFYLPCIFKFFAFSFQSLLEV